MNYGHAPTELKDIERREEPSATFRWGVVALKTAENGAVLTIHLGWVRTQSTATLVCEWLADQYTTMAIARLEFLRGKRIG